MAKSTVAVKFTGDTADLKRSLGQVDDGMNKIGGRMSSAGAGIAKFAKVAAVGFAAIGVGAVVVGKQLIDAAIESEKVTKQTAAVIKSMGGASKVTAKQVEDLSGRLSAMSGVDDELIQSGQNVLLTFGKVRNEAGKGNKIFDRATEAVLNMSVALGTDLKAANVQVGKALNDPIKGITALSRVGVSFTEDQKKMIKSLVETGDVLGAQKIILGELEKQFGGSAAAQATAGEKLAVVWGNLQEDLGERLLPLFETVANWLAKALPAALDFLSDALGPVIDGISELVSEGFEKVRGWWAQHSATLSGYWTAFSDAATTALGVVSTFLTETLVPALVDFADWFIENETAVVAAIGGIAAAFAAWAVSAGAAALASLAAAWPLLLVAAVAAGVVAILYTLSNRGDGVVSTFGRMVAAAVAIWEGFRRIFGFVGRLFQQLAVGALIMSGTVVAAFQPIIDVIQTVWSFLGDVIGRVKMLITWLGRIKVPSINIPGGGLIERGLGMIPKFANGGVMPGPRGQHSLAMVAGGETILPTHKTTRSTVTAAPTIIHVHVAGSVLSERDLVATINRAVGKGIR